MRNHARSLSLWLAITAAFGFASCSDQPSDSPDPISSHGTPRLVMVSGDNQTARVRNDVPSPLVVQVLDKDSKPMEGVSVSWTVLTGDGNLTPYSSTTDSRGNSEAAWTLGGVASEQRAKATFGPLSVTFTVQATPGEPASVARWSGDSQRGIVGTQLADPIAVIVRDADDNPVAGVAINWEVVHGTSTLNPTVSLTDASGIARTAWTLGMDVGGSVARGSLAPIGEAQFFAEALDTEGRSAPQSVANLILTPEGVSLSAIGSQTTLSADAYNNAAKKVNGVAIGWLSLNPAIASVDGTGRVTAVAPGVTRVVATALCCNKTDTAKVVIAQQATSVVIDPKPVSVPVGGTFGVTASARDAGGTVVPGTPISWSSSNTTVATVSQGVITGLKSGTAKVRAASGSLLDSVAVTVGTITTASPAISSITVNPAAVSLTVSQSSDLNAVAYDASGNPIVGQTFTWTSSNVAVANVSSSGRVSALAAGTATITAKAGEKRATATITVSTTTASIASVSLTPTSSSIAVGRTLQLTATALNASGQALTGYSFAFTSANPQVAIVNASGLVTALAAGTAQISASAGGKIGYASVTVTTSTTSQTVARVVLTQDTIIFKALNGQSTLAATAYDASGQVLPGTAFSWSSSKATVATVDSLGRVTSRGIGTALIIATAICCNDADTTTALVRQDIASLTVSPRSTTIETGSSLTLNAVAKDANGNVMTGQNFTWSSSNPTIASVVNGVVVALGLGVATVRVTSGAFTDSSVITVQAPGTSWNGQLHEPAGNTKFFSADGSQRDFGSAWIKAPRWLEDQYTQVVPDASNPTGSGMTIEKRWYIGQPGDNGNGLTTLRHFSDVGGFPSRVLYIRLRVKFSPNYDMTANYGGMKFGYWGMQGGPNATYMAWVDTDGMKPYVFLGAENPTPHKFGSNGTFKPNTWHTLEMVITAQSAKGAADGRYEWWIDGNKIVDATNQAFVSASSSLGNLIDGYQLYFIRASTSVTFKTDDWVRIGELYISGAK